MSQKIEITETSSIEQEHLFEHVHFLEERTSRLENEVYELRSIFMDMLVDDEDDEDTDDDEEDEDEEEEDDDSVVADFLRESR